MQITFLGVGEACDPEYPNTSLLLRADAAGENRTLLFDCGFTVPPAFFRTVVDPDELDAVWISHFHGDHFFGLPLLMLGLRDVGRSRPLLIAGQEGIENLARNAMELAYPRFLRKLPYSLQFAVVEPGTTVDCLGFTWESAENEHGIRSLALRIDNGQSALFYSGDGRPTPETQRLARGCDVVVHESYSVEDASVRGHGSAAGCIEFARRANVARLALVHFKRDQRSTRRAALQRLIDEAAAADLTVDVPEPGDEILTGADG